MTQALYGSTLSSNSNQRPSESIWGECRQQEIRDGIVNGTYLDIDYGDIPFIGTQTTEIAIGLGSLKGFNTGAGTLVGKSAVNSVEKAGGLLAIALDTDNDSGSFAQSYPKFLLSGLSSNSGKLWFEHRMCFTGILTNGIGWILGLAETELFTLATGVPLNGSDALTNAGSFIGFNKLEDGLGVINTCKSDRAAQAPTAIQSSVGSVAAFEFFKLGMTYDPDRVTDCIRFYFNGVQLATAMSRSDLTAHTNLDANALGLLFASVADSSGTTSESFHDWTKIYQELP